jgi:hypothetical protein
MKNRLVSFLLFVVMASAAVADDTGTVSLVGRNDDTSDTKTFGLMLVIADHTWREFETANATHYFVTKKGIWIEIAPNDIVLRDEKNTKRVGEVTQLNTAKAKRGDKGPGKAEETGITFHWEVQ